MALADVLRKIFGSKSDRDMKAVKPVLDKVLAAYPAIDALSNDGLRAKTAELRARVMEVEAPFEERIAEIKAELEAKGHKVTGSVTKNTDYLLCESRDSQSTKAKKARELGTRVIGEAELADILG